MIQLPRDFKEFLQLLNAHQIEYLVELVTRLLSLPRRHQDTKRTKSLAKRSLLSFFVPLGLGG